MTNEKWVRETFLLEHVNHWDDGEDTLKAMLTIIVRLRWALKMTALTPDNPLSEIMGVGHFAIPAPTVKRLARSMAAFDRVVGGLRDFHDE